MDLVKDFIVDTWEECKSNSMAIVNALNGPVLALRLRIMGMLPGLLGTRVSRCWEVSLAQVSWMIVYVYVAPPLTMGAWSMAMAA